MPHYHHFTDGSACLYDRSERLCVRMTDMADELLADGLVHGELRAVASVLKDAVARLRDLTVEPRRWQGARRERVEAAGRACG
jgi:hypothetical protein